MLTIETIHWHTLCSNYLNWSSNVLDLGANCGLFAVKIVERFGCHCVAIEPSPIPFNSIKANDRITKIQAAIGGRSGVMGFRVDDQNELASSLSDEGNIKVRVETLPEILRSLGCDRVDLLKVDIEGEEIAMLENCSDDFLRARIGQMSIEFHDFCNYYPAGVVSKTIDRLNRLGFASVRMSRIGHQDTWFINRNMYQISNLELACARHITRNWFGLKRVIARNLERY